MAILGLSSLDAVNRMLRAVGERPEAALDTGGSSLAADAERVLTDTNRTIQAYGWPENTRFFVTMTADGAGVITLPPETLMVWPSGRDEYRTLTIFNGDILYDMNADSEAFAAGESVMLDYVRLMGFENISPRLKELITCTAAVYFQQEVRGSATMNNFLRQAQILADMMADRTQSRLARRPINLRPLIEFMQPPAQGGRGG